MRIVVADDVDVQRWMLVGILRTQGHEVVAACENGRQAIDAVKLHDPDVVILDNAMLVLSGVEAAREIAQLSPAPRIILATNQGQPGVESAADDIGALLLLKPYKPAKLETALESVMAHG